MYHARACFLLRIGCGSVSCKDDYSSHATEGASLTVPCFLTDRSVEEREDQAKEDLPQRHQEAKTEGQAEVTWHERWSRAEGRRLDEGPARAYARRDVTVLDAAQACRVAVSASATHLPAVVPGRLRGASSLAFSRVTRDLTSSPDLHSLSTVFTQAFLDGSFMKIFLLYQNICIRYHVLFYSSVQSYW